MAGSVKKYTAKRAENGYLWEIRWDLPEGPGGKRQQRREGNFRTKDEAQKRLREVLTSQGEGRPMIRVTETVSDAVEAFLRAKQARGMAETTMDLWTTVLRVHVVPRIGHLKVSAVDALTVERLYTELSLHGKAVFYEAGVCRTSAVTCAKFGCSPERHTGLSPTTVRHVAAALRAVLRRSLGSRAALPTDDERAREALPKAGNVRVTPSDYWTDDQARRFLAETGEHRYGTVFALALATGMRRSELSGLKWADLTLEGDEPHLWVRQTITSVRGRMIEKDGGKSKAAVRKVPLGSVTVAALLRHRKAQAVAALATKPGEWTDTGRVFTEADGQPVNPASFTKAFAKASADAGLPNAGLHGCRHFAITSMLRRGVPVTTVAKIVGHEDVGVTLNIYAYAVPNDDRLAASAMDSALSA